MNWQTKLIALVIVGVILYVIEWWVIIRALKRDEREAHEEQRAGREDPFAPRW